MKIINVNMHVGLLFLISCTLLLGCSEDISATNSIRKNGVIYCSEGSPETFNPQLVTSMITVDATSHQIYNRLLEFKIEDNTLGPALANSWHVTKDGKIITFYLRKDVEFHHTPYFTPTRKFNADDVLFTFNRVLNKNHPYHNIGGGKYPFFQSVDFSGLVDSIEKVNDYTIRFKLNHPDSSFLANLATDFSVILSQEYGDFLANKNEKAQFDHLPIGTGPFKFKEYIPGALIRYYKNELYWRHDINIEQLVFDITPSNTGRLTKLITSECDIIAYPIAHSQISANPSLTLQQVTSYNVSYLAFNTQKVPFNNPLVRQAIAHAINKQAIVDNVYSGQASVAASLLPKNSWAYSEDILSAPYSIALAKSLLTEAGYPNGFSMDLWAMPVQRAYNPNALKMAKLVHADLAAIGISVNIVSYEWTTFLRKLNVGEHHAALIGWSADHPDPDNFFTPLLSCNSLITGNNRAFWCNETFDGLISKALLTINTLERKKLYFEAQTIIADQVPLLPIAHSQRYQAKSNDIHGEILTPFGGVNLSQVGKN